MNKKFTTRTIQSLKVKPKRYEVWETGRKGFGLRVSPAGRKSFIFLYRFDGKPRRLTIGTFPQISLATAHKRHGEAEVKLDQGLDPGEQTKSEKRANRDAPTVDDLIAEYIEKWAKPRKRSWRTDERVLNREVSPKWGHKKASSITRRDVIQLLDVVVDRPAPIMANRLFEIIRKMFNFGVGRDIVSASPCVAIPKPANENQRDRVLNESEIKQFWSILPACKMSEQIRLALQLLLVTAQRKSEVAKAKTEEFDLNSGWWVIPGERTKNGLPHRIPLSGLAISLIKQAHALAENSEFLFSSKATGRPMTDNALNKALTRNRNVLAIDHFTPRDLRKTAASMITSMEFPRLTVGKILNHVESGVTAVYDRYAYDREKKKALDAWARKLQAIIEGSESNVIPLTN